MNMKKERDWFAISFVATVIVINIIGSLIFNLVVW